MPPNDRTLLTEINFRKASSAEPNGHHMRANERPALRAQPCGAGKLQAPFIHHEWSLYFADTCVPVTSPAHLHSRAVLFRYSHPPKTARIEQPRMTFERRFYW
jgi:hypothetical protein